MFVLGWVPGRQHNAATVRVCLDQVDAMLELVESLPSVVRVFVHVLSTKVSPLEPVRGSEVTLLSVSETELVERLAA